MKVLAFCIPYTGPGKQVDISWECSIEFISTGPSVTVLRDCGYGCAGDSLKAKTGHV